MKKFQLTIGVLLLIALTLTFINCTKDDPEPTTPTFNYSTFTDSRDGKIYKTFKIGKVEWMAQNLAYKTESGSWSYWNSNESEAQYGRLYTWESAKLAVPTGWHLSTDQEWKDLEISLGMSQTDADLKEFRGTDQGSKLKSKAGWAEHGNGIDAVSFTALPGGYRSNFGSFNQIEWYGFWWTATETDNSMAWYRLLVSNSSQISRNLSYKGEGFSVRCVKD